MEKKEILKYEQVLTDKLVINEYAKYNSRLHIDHGCHGISHACSVVKTSEKVARLFRFTDTQINEIKITALLHDIGTGEKGKDGHAKRSAEWAIIEFNIDLFRYTKVLD